MTRRADHARAPGSADNRSTIVAPGPVHTGLTAAPAAETDRLLACLVLPLDGR